MRRRTILGSAGTTLSIALAGCGDSGSDDEGESETNGSDGAADGGRSEDANESDDEQLREDESVEGEVDVSAAAGEFLSAERHTFTRADDSPDDRCQVHVELENVGDSERALDAAARIYDEGGTELSSTRYADEPGPVPGETAVYSFALTNCADTAAYEIEVDESGGLGGSDALLIDDFEEYDGGGLYRSWTLDGTGDAAVVSEAALHPDSSRGLRQEGDSNVRSFPGQGLSNYPEDGSEVSVLMRPNSNTFQPWILFGMEEDVWSTETPGWRLIIDPNGGIRIARETGDGAEILAKDSTLPSLVGETVDCRFVADSDAGVEFWIQDLEGATLGGVNTNETAGIDGEMSIGFRSAQGVDWDWPRLVGDDG